MYINGVKVGSHEGGHLPFAGNGLELGDDAAAPVDDCPEEVKREYADVYRLALRENKILTINRVFRVPEDIE